MSRTVNIEVDIDLDNFDTDDLIAELKRRNVNGSYLIQENLVSLIQTIYDNRMLKKDYQKALDELIWEVLGRIS